MVTNNEIKQLIVLTTLIFFLAPFFLLIYVIIYNRRKKRHVQEKVAMELAFAEELIKAQLEIQERTLQTVGTDLHDNIGQLLSLTSLTLKSIDGYDPEGRSAIKVAAAIELTAKCIKEMRLLGKLLQGEQLVDLGLAEAVRQEADWLARTGSFKISCRISSSLPPPDGQKDLLVFRMLQEMLNNCIKHALPTEIGIELVFNNHYLVLSVEDNGSGFDTAGAKSGTGMGLENIRKRSRILNGEVLISSAIGSGTTIQITIPYGAEPDRHRHR